MASRAVGYVRVSTPEQAEANTSLAHQEREIRRFADRSDIELLEVFVERGVSARSLKRVELNRLRTFYADRSNNVDSLIIWKFDRLCRDVRGHVVLRAELHAAAIQVISVTEPTSDDPAGVLMENILASFAQFENDVRAERTRAGMGSTARRGRWQTRAPFGYRRGSADGPSLLLHETEAPVVREIFERSAGNCSREQLVREFEARGVVSKTNRPLSGKALHRILTNPVYLGKVVWKGNTYPGDFEPIVGSPLFQRLQGRIRRGARVPSGSDKRQQERISAERSRIEKVVYELEAATSPAYINYQWLTQMLTEPAEIWDRLDGPARRTFQRLVFPFGLPVAGRAVGTGEPAPIFLLVREKTKSRDVQDASASRKVALTGFEPVSPP